MTLENAKTTLPKLIEIPDVFQSKVTILSNCDLESSEVDIFNLSLKIILEYINDYNIDLVGSEKLNIVFTNDGSFSFVEKDNSVYGSQFQLIIYNMNKIRSTNYNYIIMLFVFIEELAHYLLRIYDEILIKQKVAEIIQYAIPDFDLNDMKGVLYGI